METNQNPGCLTVILQAIGIKLKSPEPKTELFPYKIKDHFLSPAELSFYRILKSIVDPHLTILSKVRLADIFYVSRPKENYSYFPKISQKHVDYLLCHPDTMKPILGIELDDSSHNTEKSQKRDQFVNRTFATAKLPLLRVPVQKAYKANEITVLLRNAMKKNNNGEA